MKKLALFSVIAALLFCSCEKANDLLNNNISESEVVDGLKTALKIGADSASTSLSVVNGYYNGSPALAIIQLPDEVSTVRNSINNNNTVALISSTVGLDGKFDEVILGINRAAEEAAKEASPIFVDAITDLSIVDAMDILNGRAPGSSKSAHEFDSTAATNYFKTATYSALVDLYAPKINVSLDKDLVSGKSANDIWGSFTSSYNSLLSNINSNFLTSGLDEQLGLPSAFNTNLGEYCTEKALDELFFRVGEEEKKIRNDPFAWGIQILEKVFGSILS